MKHPLCFILFSFFCGGIFCQQEIPEFGQPTMKELLLKDCDFEKGVSALTLYKFEETELISDQMTTKTEYFQRIKIFTQAGYSFASIEIPFAKKNKIKNFSALIYNLDENGKITTRKIDKEEIYKKLESKKKGSLVFTFPGLKPGSVVEYKYSEIEKESSRFDVKYFQDKIPVQLCIFKIITPDYMHTDLSFLGDAENTEKSIERKTPTETRNTETIIRKNIPAFQNEPFMSSVRDNLQHIIINYAYNVSWQDSLRSGNGKGYYILQWAELNDVLRFHPFFGSQIQINILGTNQIIDSAKQMNEPSKIVDFIYRRVKNKIKWNNYEMMYAEDLQKAWNTGTGSSAEINFTILNLLRKSGIECYPILVRPREYGKASKTYYTLRQFTNINVLVLDSSNYYVLDGTQKFLPYSTPPFEILNRDVFLVDKGRSGWLTIIDQRPFFKKVTSIKAEVDTNGTLTGQAFSSNFDYIKNILLTEKEKKDTKEDDDKSDFLKNKSLEIKIDSLIENSPDESKPLNQNFGFTYSPEISVDYIYIDPYFLSTFRKNPFLESKRQTDIDFGSNQIYNSTLHLTIPDNYAFEAIPKNEVILANDSSLTFKRQTIQQENVLIFKYTFEINRAIFSKEEYESVREYFRKMYAAIQEQIILRKK